VTQAEWQGRAKPARMLALLRGKAGPRKFRLFACACCRHLWPLLTDPRSRAAVEAAERYAEGRATPEELHAAYRAAQAAAKAAWDVTDLPGADVDALVAAHRAAEAARAAAEVACEEAAVSASVVAAAAGLNPYADEPAFKAYVADQHDSQCRLIRCIFGDPFRQLLPVDPAWLAANDGAVPELAYGIYQDRAFGRLQELARALQDVGCSDPELLGHLRGPGPHALGCWALDAVLDRS
jgi:hypothetical protein